MKIPTDIIHDVVEVLEEVLAEKNRSLTPSNKAELVVLLCQEIKGQERREAKLSQRDVVKSTIKNAVDKK